MSKKFGVAVKAIVKKNDEYLILHKSESEDINPKEVDIPGGRVEFGEKVEDALLRELKEETGLDIEILKPTRTWGFVKDELHLIGITFLANYKKGEVVLCDEHDKYKWVKKEFVLNNDFPDWIKEEFSAL